MMTIGGGAGRPGRRARTGITRELRRNPPARAKRLPPTTGGRGAVTVVAAGAPTPALIVTPNVVRE